jgi:hypothetical protein
MIKLTIIGFDCMENSTDQAEFILEEKYFVDKDDIPARICCGQYISTGSFKPYLTWNNEVYPKYKISNVFIE